MPSLDPRDVALNKYLADYVLAYRPQGLIGPRLFPVQSVPNQSGTFASIVKDQTMRPASTLHNPGEEPKTSLVTLTTTSYYCQGYRYGAEAVYEFDTSDFAVIDRLTDATLDRISFDQEMRCVTKIFTGVGSSLTAPVAFTVQSGNVNTSCPTSYFNVAIEAVRATSGLKPNIVVCPQQVFNVLMHHPDIRANGVGNTAVERLASVCQVAPENLLIPYARVLTNQEGQANTFFDVWSTNMLFAYVSPSGPSTATFATAFRWKGPGQGFDDGPPSLRAWLSRDDEKGTTCIYAGYYQDERIVDASLCFLLTSGI